MDQWTCGHCTALNPQNKDKCWNCDRGKDDPLPIPRADLPSQTPSEIGVESSSTVVQFVRIAIAVVGAFLLLVARGMQINPNSLDQIVGVGVHTVTVILLFVVLFHWRRTALRPPELKKHRTGVVIGQCLAGAGLLVAVLAVLLLGTFGGKVAQMIVSSRFDFFGILLHLIVGVSALAAGFGLYRGTSWSSPLAKIVSFPVSFGWPLGLVLAFYTWWVLSPRRDSE